jgi:hypothetical protein
MTIKNRDALASIPAVFKAFIPDLLTGKNAI